MLPPYKDLTPLYQKLETPQYSTTSPQLQLPFYLLPQLLLSLTFLYLLVLLHHQHHRQWQLPLLIPGRMEV